MGGISLQAGLQGRHLAAGRGDSLKCLLCEFHCDVAADERSSFSREGQRGCTAHGSACAGDEADLAG